jgi:tetratricopeptide (TPR) repeat protein
MSACQLLFDLGEKTVVEQVLLELQQRVTDFDDELRRRLIAMLASVCLFDQPEKSLTLLREEETLCHKTRNSTALAACIGNQATALRQSGKLIEARNRHIIEEKLCRKLNNLRLLAGSLNNQAQIEVMMQEYERAASYLPELDSLARTLRDLRLLGSCHEIRGVCLIARNKHAKAVRSLSQAADAYQEAVDQNALTYCLLRLARTHYLLGDFDAAITNLDRGINSVADPALKSILIFESNNLLNQFEV